MMHPLGPRPSSGDAMVAAARAANLGASLEIEARQRRQLYAEADRERPCACSLDIERIVAALCALSTKLDDVEAVADYAAERAETVEGWSR